MAVFRFDSALHRFVIESLHPGVSPAQVVANTGFSVEIGDDAEKTFPPTEEELAIIRSEVKEELIQIYPDFASRL
jgi:glutaconate CoA-transferase subunit B